MELAVLNRPRVLLRRRGYRFAKRVLDLTLCLLALPFALVIMLISVVAIALDSPGPILFIRDRIGKGGRHFKLYKFRTMYHNSDTTGYRAFMKAFVQGEIGERELTRVGRILRKTSLDELPQLWNVIKGEMSLVGPRPNVLWAVEEYRGWHKERLEVMPGITGLAQINGRSSNTFDQIVRYDIEYIEHQSLRLDLEVLWRTTLLVLAGKGAH
jgi:lipopolysaccharide/colanic/teichoic acid biosynthesis glycosyltransferase